MAPRQQSLEPLGDEEYFQSTNWTFTETDLNGFAFTFDAGGKDLPLTPKQLSFTPGAAIDGKG